MSEKEAVSSGARRGAAAKLTFAATLVLTLALAGVAGGCALRWHAARSRLATLEREAAALAARNAVLSRAEVALRGHDFQVCNKSGDSLALPWLAAVHQDGQRLLLFDSARCSGWRAPFLAAGDSKPLLWSSTEEGCNWNGQVILYAMNAVRSSDEGAASYNVIGAWGRDFDPKCFNVR